jgi:polysaccharide chain length determinant protein (PEP-CTERM system associated)
MFQRELTPEDYIAMLRRRWLLIFILAVVGTPIAYGVSLWLPSIYKSTSLVMVEQPTVPENFVRPVANTNINQRLVSMQQQILSQARMEALIHQFGLYPLEINNHVPIAALAARLRAAIQVSPIHSPDDSEPGTPGFYVNVTLGNPRSAQDVCTAITSMFIQESSRRRQEQTEQTTQFLDQQIAEAKTRLDEQDAKLAAFQSRHLGSLPEEEPANLNLLTGLASQLDATTQAITHAQQDRSLAESMLMQQIAARRASRTGQNPETFGQQLAALQTQLATLQSRYTNDYPDVIKTKIEIEALKKKMAESEDQNRGEAPNQAEKSSMEPVELIQLRAQIRSDEQSIAQKTKEQERIQGQIKSFQSYVQSTPAVGQEYKQLTRDHQTALDLYTNLLRKRSDSVMAAALELRQQGEQFRVVDPASLPGLPTYPNRPLFALGGFGGGLALGLGLAFLLEMRDTSLRTERDVEVSLQLPVLAMVPTIKPSSGSKPTQPLAQTPAHSGASVGTGA